MDCYRRDLCDRIIFCSSVHRLLLWSINYNWYDVQSNRRILVLCFIYFIWFDPFTSIHYGQCSKWILLKCMLKTIWVLPWQFNSIQHRNTHTPRESTSSLPPPPFGFPLRSPPTARCQIALCLVDRPQWSVVHTTRQILKQNQTI